MTTKHLGAKDGMAFYHTRGSGRTTLTLLQIVRQLRDGNSVILNAYNMDYCRELVHKVRKSMDVLGFQTFDFMVQGAYCGFYIKHPMTGDRVHLLRGNQLHHSGTYGMYKKELDALVFTDHYRGE